MISTDPGYSEDYNHTNNLIILKYVIHLTKTRLIL